MSASPSAVSRQTARPAFTSTMRPESITFDMSPISCAECSARWSATTMSQRTSAGARRAISASVISASDFFVEPSDMVGAATGAATNA